MAGQASDSSDQYVSGGVNWEGFSLQQLVAMVSDEASVPQLTRLAQDWRDTGDGITDAAEYLGDALDDLMNFWSGEAADKAKHVVALNAQWVADLGATAYEMGGPIDQAAGALRAAQEAMPPLPDPMPREFPGAAPQAAADMESLTGSPLGAAFGATAEGSQSGFAATAEQEEMKRIAVETMQRFEAAAMGIDQETPRFLGQDNVLRPDPVPVDPKDPIWAEKVPTTSGVDKRWQLLTGVTDPASGAPLPSGAFGSGEAGSITGRDFGAVAMGSGGGAGADSALTGGRPGAGRPEVLPFGRGLGAGGPVLGGVGQGGAPMGAAPMAPGAGAGGSDSQQHRRRVPVDDDDPFDSGHKVSPPVIGL